MNERKETISDLKARCKLNYLSTKGKKSELQARLANPDQYRVMYGTDKSVKINDNFTIENLCIVCIIRDNYSTIGHPTGKNMHEWRNVLIDFNGDDAHLYGVVNQLKNTPNVSSSSSSSSSTTATESSKKKHNSSALVSSRPTKKSRNLATEKSNMAPAKETTNNGWSCQRCKKTRSLDTEKFSCEACAKEICEACCNACDERFCTGRITYCNRC
jgi:hypothetical protein